MTVAKLAEWTGLSERTVQRRQNELVEREWLVIEPCFDANGRRIENDYELLLGPVTPLSPRPDTTVTSPRQDGGVGDTGDTYVGDTGVTTITRPETNYPSGHLSSEPSPSVTRANGSGKPLAVGEGRAEAVPCGLVTRPSLQPLPLQRKSRPSRRS